MSQIGLLRVLLYEILHVHHDLVPIVFPPRGNSSRFEDGKDRLWSISELKQAFEMLVTQESILIKICFFVDGLDEYDGNSPGSYTELIEMFKEYSQRPNIKFCLSSRPLQIFVDELSAFPHLRLQDLTENDIRLFVSRMLSKNRRMRKLQNDNPAKAAELIIDLVEKADGVFLWVDLVVKSLLDGLQDRNTLADLSKRVELSPSKLRDLYTDMFNSIDPTYHSECSRVFQVFRATLTPDILFLSFSNYVDTSTATKHLIRPLLEAESKERRDYLEVVLKTRCAGLLEYDTERKNVAYIHRTARDFVEQDNVWAKIRFWSELHNYNLLESLLAAYLFHVKTIQPEHESLIDFWVATMEAFMYARTLHFTCSNFCISLLDEIDKSMEVHWQTWAAKAESPRDSLESVAGWCCLT